MPPKVHRDIELSNEMRGSAPALAFSLHLVITKELASLQQQAQNISLLKQLTDKQL